MQGGFGQPPGGGNGGGFGQPPQGGFGTPPPQQGGFGGNTPPPQGGFGTPPPQQGGFGGNTPPPQGGFGAPPQGGFGAPPQGGFGAPPAGGFGQTGGAQHSGFGPPPAGGPSVGAPPPPPMAGGQPPSGGEQPPNNIGLIIAALWLAVGMLGCVGTGVAGAMGEQLGMNVSYIGLPLFAGGASAMIVAPFLRTKGAPAAIGAPVGCGCVGFIAAGLALAVFYIAVWPSL